MKSFLQLALALSMILAGVPTLLFAQGPAPTVSLDKAALSPEVSNDQRQMLSPGQGKRFLWVAAKLSGPPTVVDLTKVTLVSGSDAFPLIGVDSAWGGEPKQFSMVAPVLSKDAESLDPLEETRSDGSVAFAFSPKTKTASLKVIQPPQSVCLLFAVPQTFKAGQISGLGAKPLPLPALPAGARP